MRREDYPIIEYDPTRRAVIEPSSILKQLDISEYCVPCFFQEVIDKLNKQGKLKLITHMKSEMGKHPIYELEHMGKKINIFHPGLGAPFVAATMEEVIALGGRKFIACGGAGVLKKEIEAGYLIVPDTAVRDEGVSYHYLPPSRELKVKRRAFNAIVNTLNDHGVKYIIGKTWTTSAFYRETPERVKLRRSEGCIAVEMECAAFIAVAEFRNVEFAQILYGGDDVSGLEWDSREWNTKTSIREKIFWLAVEACFRL